MPWIFKLIYLNLCFGFEQTRVTRRNPVFHNQQDETNESTARDREAENDRNTEKVRELDREIELESTEDLVPTMDLKRSKFRRDRQGVGSQHGPAPPIVYNLIGPPVLKASEFTLQTVEYLERIDASLPRAEPVVRNFEQLLGPMEGPFKMLAKEALKRNGVKAEDKMVLKSIIANRDNPIRREIVNAYVEIGVSKLVKASRKARTELLDRKASPLVLPQVASPLFL
jgi:hypothetical protein